MKVCVQDGIGKASIARNLNAASWNYRHGIALSSGSRTGNGFGEGVEQAKRPFFHGIFF
jgi:hypothetical protein